MIKRVTTYLTVFLFISLLLSTSIWAIDNNSYVAVSKVIASSSTDVLHPAGYLIDSDKDTGWSFKSDAIEGWVELKLEHKSLIQGLDLSGALAANTELKIEYKQGNYWVPFIAPSIDTLAGDSFMDLSYDGIVTDKIRLKIEGSGTRSSTLTEIKVLGEIADSIYHAIEIESVNASENTEYTYPAKFLVDGNTYTMWKTKVNSNDWRDRKFDKVLNSEPGKEIFNRKKGSNNQNQAQVLFKLGQSYSLNNLNIYFSDQAKGDIEIEVNSNGKWHKIDYISDSSQEGWYHFELAEAIITDQVRLIVTGYGGGLGGISEVQFWGKGFYKGVSEKLIGIQAATPLDEPINRHFTLTNEELKDYYLELAIKEESNNSLTVELNGREFDLEPTFNLRGYTIYRKKIKQNYLWTGSNFLKVVPTSKDLTLVNARLRAIENRYRQSHLIDQLGDGILFNGANNKQELELSLIPEGYKLPDFPDFPEFPTELEDKGNVRIKDWSGVTLVADDGYYNRLDVITSLVIDTSNGDRVIRVKNLRLGSNADISIKGNGRLYLYVENNLEIKGGSRINGSGKKDAIVIYHSGDRVRLQGGVGGNDKYKFAGTIYTQADKINISGGAAVQGTIYIQDGNLRITGGSTVAGGSFYTRAGKINITGGAKVEGSLLSGGEEIVITGGSTIAGDNGGIYAPNAWIDLDGGSTIQGKIIATSEKVGIGHINYRESYYSIPQIDFSGETRLIEEVEIYSKDNHPYFNLYAWVDGSWVEIYETESGLKSVKYQESIKTDKLLVKNPSGFSIGEIRVKGTATTKREAEIKILNPEDGEVLINRGLGKEKIIGFVDNPDTEIKINGHQVWKRGHYFWLEANRVGIKRWEENSIFAVAKDKQGRVSSDEVKVLAGEKSFITIDQPEEIVYTGKKSFKISGSIKRPLNKLMINGEEVKLKGHKFKKNIELEEGFNLIEIEAAHEKYNGKRKFVKKNYLKVVYRSGAIDLRIDSPISGYYTDQNKIIVSGMVDGLGDVKVKVNGQEARIDGMFYTSPPILLSEGSNLIKVEAVDQLAKVKKEVRVVKDSIAPVLKNISPEEGYLSNESKIDVSGDVTDVNPVWVYVDGKVVSINEDYFKRQVVYPDGNQLISIKAIDLAGNSVEKKVDVMVDTTAPLAFEVTADPAGWTNDTKPILSFETTDKTSGVDHYELSIDGGEFQEVSSPYQLPEQSDGEHELKVKAVDKAGWETIAETKVYIDTTPPDIPDNFRTVPGNGRMILRWDEPNEDVIEYRIEREPVGSEGYYVVRDTEFIDSDLINGNKYKYRIWAVDRAYNKSLMSDWKTGTVGLAEAPYSREEGGLIEYDGVSLALPQEGLPEDVAKVEVTEIKSDYLEEKSLYPMVGPIYEFSAFKEGSKTPEESMVFDKGYLAKIEYDESLVPEGFLERNLGVYHYDPMFDKWFLIPSAGVDIENNTIYFVTDHFSAFSVQATIMQDLSPQEYKDTGYSPLNTYAKHGGVVVSPQGGSASTQVTDLELPGRNGFDLTLSRKYNTSVARMDSFSMAVNAELGFNILSSNNDGSSAEEAGAFLSWDDIKDSADFSMDFSGVSSSIISTIEKYLSNQGDYAYSMGQGWRLNIPYVKKSNSSIILSTGKGNMYYINEMDISKTEYPEDLNYKRVLTFEHHEGEDFTFIVEQVKLSIDGITTITGDNFTKGRWYSKSYKLILKDGTTYEMDFLGRTKKKTDPFGINQIEFHYGKDLLLDYIEDSIGRRVKFDYHWTLMWPRIKKIWVEDDPYNRKISYDVDSYSKLEKVTDIGGRVSKYDYDIKLLYGGEAGVELNTALMLTKIIANIFPGGGEIVGAVASAFGEKDITLYARLKVQFVVALSEMEVPGQGLTKINYKRYKFTHCGVDIDKVLGIPTSITLSVTMDQRLMTRKVDVYLKGGGERIKEVTYDYNVRYSQHKQSHNFQTIENDGKRKTIYHYKPIKKRRKRWEDEYKKVKIGEDYKNNYNDSGSGIGKSDDVIAVPVTIRTVNWSTHVLGVNDVTEVYDVKSDKLLRRYEREYDEAKTMRLIKEVRRRGDEYRRVKYKYDDWGNIISTTDSGTGLETRSYYLNTDSSREGFEETPFVQKGVKSDIHNLIGAKIVYNRDPRDESKTKIESSYQYDDKGQRLIEARYHLDTESSKGKWLETAYQYDKYGNVIKQIEPKGNVTEFKYSNEYNHAFVTLIKKYQGEDELYLKNADNEEIPAVVQRYGYDVALGLKSWEINPEGNLTEYEYDSLSRLVKITYPEDGEVPAKNIEDIVLADYGDRSDNPVKVQSYDDENYITTVVNATKDIAVDDSRITDNNLSEPIFNKSKYDYDQLGRWRKLEQFLKKDNIIEVVETSFEYDGRGNRIETTDAEGKLTKKEYDALDRVTKITYPDRNYATIEYNEEEFSKTITDKEMNQTVEIADWEGNVTSVARKLKNGVSYIKFAQYDAVGNQIAMIDEEGRVTNHYYNDLNQLVKEELPEDDYVVNGLLQPIKAVISYQYDDNGNKIGEVSPKGNLRDTIDKNYLTSYEYDALNRVIKTSKYQSDDYGNITKKLVTKKYYDGLGREVKTIDPKGNSVEMVYDSRGNKIAEIDQEGNIVYHEYDLIGKEVVSYDPRGVIPSSDNLENLTGTLRDIKGESYLLVDDYRTEYYYDSLGRKVRTVYPRVNGENIAYDEEIVYDKVGNKKQVITGEQSIEYLYDDVYNVTDEVLTTPEGSRTTSYTYDRMGHKLTVTDAENRVTTYEYDDLYRLVKVIKPDNNFSEYEYDRVGNKIKEISTRGDTLGEIGENIKEYRYNSLGKLTKVYELGISNPTEYQYDIEGNLVKKIMSNSLETSYEYNNFNQMVKELKAGDGEVLYSYDELGNLATKINPLGIKEEYSYTKNNLVDEISYYEDASDSTAKEVVNYEYDRAGNRLLVEKADSSTSQEYDFFNRVIDEGRRIGAKNYSTAYKYDLYGNLVGIKYPGSDEYLEYGYDEFSQLRYIKDIAGTKDSPAFDYDLTGHITEMSYDNGVRTSFGYDEVGRPESIITTKTDIETGTQTELLKLEYDYDGEGNVNRRNNNEYTYDGVNRLRTATVEGDFYLGNSGIPGNVVNDHFGQAGLEMIDGYDNPVDTDDIEISLDYSAGSVGLQFSNIVDNISKIELKTIGIESHRLTKRTFDIYYSNKNSEYSKLNPDRWSFAKDYRGNITIFIPEPISAKYIKIHSKFDDWKNSDEPVYEGLTPIFKGYVPVDKGEFKNLIKAMVKVYRRETKVNLVYDYDSVGNRISKKIIDPAGVENTVYSYYEGTNRLKSYSVDGKDKYAYVYDNAGNLIKKGNKYSIEGEVVTFTETSGDSVEYWEYQYNLQNRLAKVYKNEELIAEFSYDADDKRIKTIEHTHDGSIKKTNFVYSVSGKVIFEDEDNNYTSFIFALNKQYAKVNGIVGASTEITYFHQDNLGSTRLMTNASGKVVMDQDYLPFGGDLAKPNQIEIQNDSGESYKYTGQKQVVSIGLYYYGARYYDPEIGRFTREDSYRGELGDPQSQHLYVYVTNNALKYTDPTGHSKENPIAKSLNSFVEIGKGFWNSATDRAGHALDSPYDFANYMTIGMLDGMVSGAKERTSKMMNSPYDFTNWLTSGAVDTVNGAVNPEEQFSAQHWMNSFEVAGWVTGGLGAMNKTGSSNLLDDAISTNSLAKQADNNLDVEGKADFYVKPDGEAVPSTGYRYMDSKYAEQTFKAKKAPGSYFGFDKFDTGSEARNALQISTEWSDARLRGKFDTLQIIDDISIPLEKGGKGPNLEPFTTSYPEFGTGGYRQVYTQSEIYFDDLNLLEE
ncbi:RHS repeat-associated core domain-containing protein [Orenia marismortui]|uniref:RHS repeat-associated protein n=1 Tax=Orenia marismortui TaxID=46469 RepID=A0A4R8H136_9FIRM|nr:RHS repeat-associated core domain-containing protein [Orenia marismortui]TDX53272.1 RHS repeat-associated protein [Orenia marismortui]